MEFLRPDQLVPEPGDLVHREARIGRVVVLAVFALVGAAWLAVPLVAGPWGFLAWPVGLMILGSVAAMTPGVRRGFQAGHWAVRLRPSGIALRLRSYLNDDLPADDPTVCWIPATEIRCVRRGRTERLLPGGKHDQLMVEKHLDVHLAHADTQVLADALARERLAPRRGRGHHHVYPVRLVAPDLVRVTWSDARLALRPGLGQALAFLERHFRTEQPLEHRLDWREVSDDQAAELARELVRMGSRMEAVKLLRVRGGLELAQARELVDQIAA